jgi:DNA-binding transcriptional regulator YhcF (GntR family)
MNVRRLTMMKKFELLNMIYENCSLSSKEILVAQYFVYKSNAQGKCYPAVNTIAEECCVSERTVQRATKKLQEKGYISIIKRMLKGKQATNEYRIIENPVEQREDQIITDIISESKNTEDVLFPMAIILLDEILGENTSDRWEDIQGVDVPFDETSMNQCPEEDTSYEVVEVVLDEQLEYPYSRLIKIEGIQKVPGNNFSYFQNINGNELSTESRILVLRFLVLKLLIHINMAALNRNYEITFVLCTFIRISDIMGLKIVYFMTHNLILSDLGVPP